MSWVRPTYKNNMMHSYGKFRKFGTDQSQMSAEPSVTVPRRLSAAKPSLVSNQHSSLSALAR